MNNKYDRNLISSFFDEYGTQEWERLIADPRSQVSLYIHKHYLHKYIKSGDRVLDIGAGPGRFTIELAKIGARICVADLSEKQLQLNEEKVKEAGFEASILWRRQMDVIDLSAIPDNEFDATICYGGPLSYVFDKAPKALSELLRVTKAEGYVFLSVMSMLGTTQLYMDLVLDVINKYGIEVIEQLIEDGDVVGKVASGNHHCHMFRWSELKQMIEEFPCEILVASALNYLSNSHEEVQKEFFTQAELWKAFLKWELDFCKEPGAIDGGTHMIVVLKNKKSDNQRF
ncbi:MAG: class I SAM-dependent methyltransferase [Candidatus Heimdallarchaeaceae archaeon]